MSVVKRVSSFAAVFLAAFCGRCEPQESPPIREISGVVLGHDKTPVSNAHVLLVREGHGWNLTRSKIDERSRFKYPLTKTDDDGKFSIKQANSDANRIQVITETGYVWIVDGNQIADLANAVIQLPEPGRISIQYDLPADSLDWEYRLWLLTLKEQTAGFRRVVSEGPLSHEGIAINNLPPGLYSFERDIHAIKTDTTILGITADRQGIVVEPGKETKVKIQHVDGFPVRGRILGIDDVKLNDGFVCIQYMAPYLPNEDGRMSSRLTAFQVIRILNEREFTTDPIPPGDYICYFMGKKSREFDLKGGVNFTVPEKGKSPELEIVVRAATDPE